MYINIESIHTIVGNEILESTLKEVKLNNVKNSITIKDVNYKDWVSNE
jgi:hypothetical protein